MKRVVIVTGTSSGLGRAFATALTRADFVVVGTVRRKEEAAKVESIQPGSSFARILDVTDEPARLSDAVEEI